MSPPRSPETGPADRPEVVYGIHPVRHALLARPAQIQRLLVTRERGREVAEILRLARQHGVPVSFEERAALQRLARGGKHQGVVSLIGPRPYVELEDVVEQARQRGEPALVLVLDGIQDPQNLGSLLRTAEACGVHGVIVPKDRAAGVTPAAVKASAGAAEHVPVARVTNLVAALGALKEAGLWVVGVTPDAGSSLYEVDLRGHVALVIGGEGSGIRRLVRERCDAAVAIPMRGRVASLNAGVAGAVVLYEALRQRGLPARPAVPPPGKDLRQGHPRQKPADVGVPGDPPAHGR